LQVEIDVNRTTVVAAPSYAAPYTQSVPVYNAPYPTQNNQPPIYNAQPPAYNQPVYPPTATAPVYSQQNVDFKAQV
jgi:hypothetical protein